jgi:shikimate dehydrogenase
VSAARRCAVLGSPVAHSLSPVLHRAAYAALGLPWTYDAIECGEAGLPGLLAGLGPEWRGLSLTMPLKRAVLPLLDESEALVGQVGAANTVVLDDGRPRGLNTDVPGLLAALAAHAVAVPPKAGVLGGGATAASAVAALGIGGARAVELRVRRPEAAEPVLRVAEVFGVEVEVAAFGPSAGALELPLIVSTVPGDAAAALAAAVPKAPGVLFDVVYDPWPTALAAAWSSRGGTVLGGLELLLHQAALQVEAFSGRPAPLAPMREAGEQALRARGRLKP